MKRVYDDDSMKEKALIHLSETELEKLFEQFDDDGSGELDFREFLCCLSLMMRGSIKEKLEMIFKIFDSEKKGFLTKTQLLQFLEFCSKSFNSSDVISITKEQMNEFIERWMKELESLEKVTLVDILEIQKDEIFQTLESKYITLHRRNTAKNMLGKLDTLE